MVMQIQGTHTPSISSTQQTQTQPTLNGKSASFIQTNQDAMKLKNTHKESSSNTSALSNKALSILNTVKEIFHSLFSSKNSFDLESASRKPVEENIYTPLPTDDTPNRAKVEVEEDPYATIKDNFQSKEETSAVPRRENRAALKNRPLPETPKPEIPNSAKVEVEEDPYATIKDNFQSKEETSAVPSRENRAALKNRPLPNLPSSATTQSKDDLIDPYATTSIDEFKDGVIFLDLDEINIDDDAKPELPEKKGEMKPDLPLKKSEIPDLPTRNYSEEEKEKIEKPIYSTIPRDYQIYDEPTKHDPLPRDNTFYDVPVKHDPFKGDIPDPVLDDQNPIDDEPIKHDPFKGDIPDPVLDNENFIDDKPRGKKESYYDVPNNTPLYDVPNNKPLENPDDIPKG